MFTSRQIRTTLIVAIFINAIALADWRDDAAVTKISGGEDYSLVLTTNKWLWACGDNSAYQLGIGNTTDDQFIPGRVHGTGDVGFLDDIDDFDAGWMHSLALDINGFVWAWGGEKNFGKIKIFLLDIRTLLCYNIATFTGILRKGRL